MDFNFTSEVPSTRGRTYIDVEHAEEVLDACLGNPGEWAQVPYTYLYPDAEGVDPKKLAVRCATSSAESNAASSHPSTSTTRRRKPAASMCISASR